MLTIAIGSASNSWMRWRAARKSRVARRRYEATLSLSVTVLCPLPVRCRLIVVAQLAAEGLKQCVESGLGEIRLRGVRRLGGAVVRGTGRAGPQGGQHTVEVPGQFGAVRGGHAGESGLEPVQSLAGRRDDVLVVVRVGAQL